MVIRFIICFFLLAFQLDADPLKLTLTIETPQPIYIGQKMKIIYKIYYQGSVELIEEELPLLEAKGFKKVGGIEVKDSEDGDYSVQIITQEFEAIQEGNYNYGPSKIAGKVTLEGKLPQTYRSQSSAVTLSVVPFPRENQPISFTGAIGSYEMDVNLLTPHQVRVGDSLKLELKISGLGDLETVLMPRLLCQPGFSGFFAMSDLPPAAKINGNSKTFTFEIRPLTPLLKEIPAIEFSFFDQESRKFKTIDSLPIPIEVLPQDGKPSEVVKMREVVDWKKVLSQAPPPVKADLSVSVDDYNRAIASENTFVRQEGLNQALSVWLEEQAHYPAAVAFENLGSYPWAIVEAFRALKDNPWNSEALEVVHRSYQKLYLPELGVSRFLFLERFFSTSMLLKLFLFFGLISLACLLVSRPTAKFMFALVAMMCLLFAGLSHYGVALRGVIIESSSLYRGTDPSAGVVIDSPVPSGSLVLILEALDDGRWLKIETADGKIGYIESQKIRAI